MNIKKITDANRAAWNETMPYHRRGRSVDYHQAFKDPDYSVLDAVETEKLKELGIDGAEIAHLSCNNGLELISAMTLGAKRGVGFDISDEAIAEACEFTKISGRNCEFIRTNVLEIGENYHGMFDIVTITVGALAWIPDLPAYFEVASAILKPGGRLLMYEIHPFTEMFLTTRDPGFDPKEPYRIGSSYFRKEPWVENDGIDYIGGTTYKSKTMYCYSMTLSDVMNAIIAGGFTIREMQEFPHDKTPFMDDLAAEGLFPLSYMVVGQKS